MRGHIWFPDDEMRQRIGGIPDHKTPLTEEGHRQARETGPALRKRFGVPDYLYHSGYLRTVQTTDGILVGYPEEERALMRVRTNLLIRERDPGFTFNMTQAEAATTFPWHQAYWDLFGSFMARPPGGESLADVLQRAYSFCDILFRDHAQQQIFIVTHAGFIRAMRTALEERTIDQATNVPPEEQQPANCGITVYEYDFKNSRLVLTNSDLVFWKQLS
jgi:broad specificity phosphatase PhoE